MSRRESLVRVSPAAVLARLAKAVPDECKKSITVVGSLAAAYHFFGRTSDMYVRTKDVDCLLLPRVDAITTGRAVTERLMHSGWTYRPDADRPTPGTAKTPEDDLPAVRLTPPHGEEWFVELLTVPEGEHDREKRWTRLVTDHGHFGLCSFGYLSLAGFRPHQTVFGISIARSEMMALGNLLEHPRIRHETMSGLFEGRTIKRSNKDLGRVLALAFLSKDEHVEQWSGLWEAALREQFPSDWQDLAARAGDGLHALLSSPADLEEAHWTCIMGLVAARPPTLDQLRRIGLRLVEDAVKPLRQRASV